MVTLYTKDGSIIREGKALATAQACCCNQSPCKCTENCNESVCPPLPHFGEGKPTWNTDKCARDICFSYGHKQGYEVRFTLRVRAIGEDCQPSGEIETVTSETTCTSSKVVWSKPEGCYQVEDEATACDERTGEGDLLYEKNVCEDDCPDFSSQVPEQPSTNCHDCCDTSADCAEGQYCDKCCAGDNFQCSPEPCGCEAIGEGCSFQYENGTAEVIQYGPECDEGFGLIRWNKSQVILGPFSYSDARYDDWRTDEGDAALNECPVFEIIDGNGSSGSADCGICGGVPYTSDCYSQRVDIRRRLFRYTSCETGLPSLQDITRWAISTGTERCPRAPCYDDPLNGCPDCNKWAGYATEEAPLDPPDPKPDCWCEPPVSWHIDTTDWISEIPQLVCDP